MREILRELIKNNPIGASRKIYCDREMRNWVDQNGYGNTFAEKIRTAVFQDSDVCSFGNKKKFKGLTAGYVGCGKAGYKQGNCKCAMLKKEETNIKRFGESNPMKTSPVRAKIVETNLAKYGTEYPQQNDNVKEKIKKTNIEKYGVGCSLHSQETTLKKKATWNEKYGVDNPSKAEVIKLKKAATLKANYGVSSPLQSTVVQAKVKSTNIERYGAAWPLASESIKQKAKDSLLSKYGCKNVKQQHIDQDILAFLDNQEAFTKFFAGKDVASAASELGVSWDIIQARKIMYDLKSTPQPRSQGERQIQQFLEENSISFVLNDRVTIAPKELDFYIPEFKLAIEFHGLYWHSEKFRPKDYHFEKYAACKESGIQLLQIFEDEWESSSSFIKQKILHLCRRTPKVIGARKLEIIECSKSELVDFLDKHHVQGMPPGATHYLKVVYKDTIVACCLLKRVTGTEVDMIRFATDQNATYPGLMSKVIKYIESKYQYETMITFADLRYSVGDVYVKSGWTEVGMHRPDYYYITERGREHKFNLRKACIQSRYGVDIAGKTEFQLTDELGLYRIWDAGKIKYSRSLNYVPLFTEE